MINTNFYPSLSPHNPENTPRFGAATPTYYLYVNEETAKPEVGFFTQAVAGLRKGLVKRAPADDSRLLADTGRLNASRREDVGSSLNFWV